MAEAQHKMGWIPSTRDVHDYPYMSLARTEAAMEELPAKVDLTKKQGETAVLDQGPLSSCTAHAGVAVFDRHQVIETGNYTPSSRLALYKWSRDLERITGDSGSTLKATAKVLGKKGAAPESLWSYDISKVDIEPPDTIRKAASKMVATSYYRIDEPFMNTATILRGMKHALVQGLPIMVGFTVYSSYTQAKETGKIPFPSSGDTVIGGHAVCIEGYDDELNIGPFTGAFKFKNSWGANWGDGGYGYLPDEYILQSQCVDMWVIAEESVVAPPTKVESETGLYSTYHYLKRTNQLKELKEVTKQFNARRGI